MNFARRLALLPLGVCVIAGLEKSSALSEWHRDWDHRSASSTASAISKANADKQQRRPSRHLVLVRHGQYSFAPRTEEMLGKVNWSKWDQLNKLTELGKVQARLTGERLREIAEHKEITFDAVHFSDQSRAAETARIIHQQLKEGTPMIEDQLLREGNPVQPEPVHPTYKPSEESVFEDGARIEAAFRRHFHRPGPEQTEDSYEIIVCHGNVIRYCVCRALQMDPEAWLRLSVYNCGITMVRISSSGNVSVSALGDTGHIPVDKVTYS